MQMNLKLEHVEGSKNPADALTRQFEEALARTAPQQHSLLVLTATKMEDAREDQLLEEVAEDNEWWVIRCHM